MEKRQNQDDQSAPQRPDADRESGGLSPAGEDRLRGSGDELLGGDADDELEDADDIDDEEEDSEGSF